MKFVRPSVLFNNAPAIGAPISDAILDTLQLIPSLVPRRERSGVMFAKAADGIVTRAAEKNPREACQYTAAHINEIVGEAEQKTTYPTKY
jgi:hypothetical protein